MNLNYIYHQTFRSDCGAGAYLLVGLDVEFELRVRGYLCYEEASGAVV